MKSQLKRIYNKTKKKTHYKQTLMQMYVERKD